MKEFLLERTPSTYFCFFLICCIKSRADRQQLLIAETLKTLKTRLFSSRFCRNAAANVPFLNISSGLSLFFVMFGSWSHFRLCAVLIRLHRVIISIFYICSFLRCTYRWCIMGPNMTSIISLAAANTRQTCVDVLLVYEANQEAEGRNRVVFTVISFLHDVSPDVVLNK